jgi:hypothetical protein
MRSPSSTLSPRERRDPDSPHGARDPINYLRVEERCPECTEEEI